MEVPHAEECISFYYQFDQAEADKLVTDTTWRRSVVAHQILSGMEHGELARRLHEPWNSLNLQTSVTWATGVPSVVFRPQDKVLKALIQLYKYNIPRPLDERVRLDQSPVALMPLICSFEVNHQWHDEELYTKHPCTSTLTRHTYPYAALPRFAPLADAGLLSVIAQTFMLQVDDVEDSLLSELDELWSSSKIREHMRLFKQPPPASAIPTPFLLQGAQPTSAKKRKQTDGDSSHPAKRMRRVAPPQPSKRSPRPAVSSKATTVARPSPPQLQDLANYPIPAPVPKRKRVDAQPQDCPQAKRVKWSPCIGPSPARTVYTRSSKAKGMAKTEAILRPGRVR
ncbi:hypothetical protein CYLTODRAFT_495144 [Cylindrobasidium torrendii FP15055 ss-10]|uniref:Uncharacterized protein n=1 Tax=Cylindrobasidium torrendii FP15055 ss-10 TaxID=1314674 RepID=A0A0D7AUY1_9AGAR|nr:hypothetical protein CYLTODRAFT_495144 [Cylindrobasidium torrendii FP15055 ss-10]